MMLLTRLIYSKCIQTSQGQEVENKQLKACSELCTIASLGANYLYPNYVGIDCDYLVEIAETEVVFPSALS